MVDVKDVKSFGRIEYDGDDDNVSRCLDSAISFLEASGIPMQENNSLYDMAALRMALHFYENREELSNFKQIPLGINTMIEQLRNTIEDEE